MATYGTLAEKRALAVRAWWCLGVSAALFVAVVLFPNAFGPVFFIRREVGAFPYVFAAVHLLLWLAGCGLYARSKGYSAVLGVVGTLCWAGFLILVVLPDRWRRALDAGSPLGPSSGPPELTNNPR